MKKVILLNLFTIAFLFAFAQKEKLPVIKSPVFKKDTLNIKKYGAVSDGNTLNAKTNDGGKPAEVHLKVLLIWQKGKSGWKLLARQAIKITQ